MAESVNQKKGTVAIIGSGPAGLFAAYVLQNDGYNVTLFEKKNNYLTLDGHSYLADNNSVVDIPMRTFSGKYYANLFQVLTHVKAQTRIHRFNYRFMKDSQQYFQFFSNFHQVIPCLRNDLRLNLCLFAWYLWYTIAIFLFPPQIVDVANKHMVIETLEQYAHRIWLPKTFLDWYLLPLFSSVATCSHNDLRCFPASYIVYYRKKTLATHHRTVLDMRDLQDKLTKNVIKKLQHEVILVSSADGKVIIEHRCLKSSTSTSDIFDYAILATSAKEASLIHPASAQVTSQLLTCPVRVTVFQLSDEQRALVRRTRPTEILMLNTRKHPVIGNVTCSTHLHPSGVAVTVSADTNLDINREHDAKPLHTVWLNRPLPTPESHRLLLAVFGKEKSGSHSNIWRNGSGNVYLVGGYASAGLPLLEACVRSGLEAAEAIGAKLPFNVIRMTPF